MTVIGKPADLVEFTTEATGTGDITGVLENVSPNRLSPWEAGLRSDDKVTLRITDGDNIEISECTCTGLGSLGWGFTRDTVRVSKVGTDAATTDKLNLSGSAIVAVVQASEDVEANAFSEPIVFPDEDPLVAGAGYWVVGVFTKSAGP